MRAHPPPRLHFRSGWIHRVVVHRGAAFLGIGINSQGPCGHRFAGHILATRADTLENLGYDARYAIDLALHPYPISQTIYYAAGVLGIQAPPTFQNINDQGGINFLHAQIPSIVLGRAAFEIELPQQQAAFMVARHLTYYRPGL